MRNGPSPTGQRTQVSVRVQRLCINNGHGRWPKPTVLFLNGLYNIINIYSIVVWESLTGIISVPLLRELQGRGSPRMDVTDIII